MFGIIKFFFWIALIATVIYFSGDLKFQDKSLKDWASTLWQEDISKRVDDVHLVDKVRALLESEEQKGLSQQEVEEVKHLIDERLSKTDKASLDKLMHQITKGDKAEPAKKSPPKADEKKK